MKIKIAVVQLHCDMPDIEKKFKKIEYYIKRASGKADIIVFPEYVIPWEFIDERDSFRKKFQEFAKKYKIDIATGSMLARHRNKLYNTTYYIDSSGKVRGVYRKINLWHQERPHIAFGNEVCVFNTKYGKIGLVICWDLAFPELYRSMTRRGVKIVICPSFWSDQDATSKGLRINPKAEEIFVDGCCLSRACENEIIHVFCNAAGVIKDKKRQWNLTGHSQITVPFKGCIRKMDHNKEGMFIQEVNTNILKDAERAYKIRKDLKSKLI